MLVRLLAWFRISAARGEDLWMPVNLNTLISHRILAQTSSDGLGMRHLTPCGRV